MKEVLIDALLDSLKILAVLIIANILIGFIESKIKNTLEKSKKWSPLIGSVFALLPQCGFSVISTDLYKKKHITMGTLIAVYIATSDEAIPVLISNINNKDVLLGLILLLTSKLFIGILVGYLVDLLYYRKINDVHDHMIKECHHHEEEHIGCCHHTIEDESKFHRYVMHPIIHALKIFAYVLVINIVFGSLMYFIGEDRFIGFLTYNKYLAPLFTTLVGMIPNCASSLLISDIYIRGGITFGALLSGLIVNAGLGIMILFKDKENSKNNWIILSILVLVALVSGYIFTLIMR